MPEEVEKWEVDSAGFLATLKAAAENKSSTVQGSRWRRAYLNLSDAADHLHAMIMRATETKEIGE